MDQQLAINILQTLSTMITIYFYALIIYIFMSWIPGARESIVGEWLGKICEPYLEIFRRFIPPIGMIDLSSIVALFFLNLFQNGLVAVFVRLIMPHLR